MAEHEHEDVTDDVPTLWPELPRMSIEDKTYVLVPRQDPSYGGFICRDCAFAPSELTYLCDTTPCHEGSHPHGMVLDTDVIYIQPLEAINKRIEGTP